MKAELRQRHEKRGPELQALTAAEGERLQVCSPPVPRFLAPLHIICHLYHFAACASFKDRILRDVLCKKRDVTCLRQRTSRCDVTGMQKSVARFFTGMQKSVARFFPKQLVCHRN